MIKDLMTCEMQKGVYSIVPYQRNDITEDGKSL